MQYRTVQDSTVQYSTVQYSTVQYSTVQYDGTVENRVLSSLHISLLKITEQGFPEAECKEFEPRLKFEKRSNMVGST